MQEFESWLQSAVAAIPDAEPELFDDTKQQFVELYQQHAQENSNLDAGAWWASLAQYAQSLHPVDTQSEVVSLSSQAVSNTEMVDLKNFPQNGTGFNDLKNRFTDTVKEIFQTYGSSNKTS